MPSSFKICLSGNDWRTIDARNGHFEGGGPVEFAYIERGKIFVADTKRVLSALQNFGNDGAVKKGSHLPFIRVNRQGREKHGETSSFNNSHCSPNACYHQPKCTPNEAPRVKSASIQTVETVEASIQTSLTPPYSANNAVTPTKLPPKSRIKIISSQNLEAKSANSVTSKNIQSKSTNIVDVNEITPQHPEAHSKPGPRTKKRSHSVAINSGQPNRKRRLSHLQDQSIPKRDKREVNAKTQIILDNNASVPVAKTYADPSIAVMIQKKDLDLIRSFLMDHSNPIQKNFDLLKFDEGGNYKLKCLCMLSPIVQIERCKEIYKMLRKGSQDSEDVISQNDFVSVLGLKSVSEKSLPQRYRMRNSNRQFNGQTDKHTKTNDNDDSTEESTSSESESDFVEVKTKMASKEKNPAKQTNKSGGKEKVSFSETNNIKDADNVSFIDRSRHLRKNNASKSCKSSSAEEVLSKHTKNKNEIQEIDLTLSESDDNSNDDNQQNHKLKSRTTLKKGKKGWYVKSKPSSKNHQDGKNENNIVTSTSRKNQTEESSSEISDSDSISEDVTPPRQIRTRRSTINETNKHELTNSRLRRRPNETDRINYSQNSEDEFVISSSNNKKMTKVNKTSENLKENIKVTETIVINDENRNDKNNNMTDTEENSVSEFKRPQRRVKQFIDLSGLDSDENNHATDKNKSSEAYFSDESDQEVKKKKITSEIKSISKKGPSSTTVYRHEYSNLEDHAIVSWVSNGGRARSVNGNRIWQELAEQYHNITGINRTWHSLRNRYLRTILPRLEVMALDSALISRLRAAAAMGEIKSRNKLPLRRNSIFGLPTRGALSRRVVRARSVEEPQAIRPKYNEDVKPQPSTSRILRSSLATSPEKSSRSPRYSEITRRFAQNYKEDTDSSTPATSRRNSMEPENARNKSPETKRSARNLPERSSQSIFNNSSQRRLLRNRSVSPESPATANNRRKSLRDKFEESKSESATKSKRKSVRRDDSNSPIATSSREKSATKSRRKSHRDESRQDDSNSPIATTSREKSATKSRRESHRDESRQDDSNSPIATTSREKSATKSRRKSHRDESRQDDSNSPIATTSREKSATKSRRKSHRDESRQDDSNSPIATTSREQSATKSRRKSHRDESRQDDSNSPIATTSREKSATKSRRKSHRDESRQDDSNSPIATTSREKSAAKSRRKSHRDESRQDDSNSPIATTSREKSAAKSRRKSHRDESDGPKLPVLTRSRRKSRSATKSPRKSHRDESDGSKSPVLTRSRRRSRSATKSPRKSHRDESGGPKSPVLGQSTTRKLSFRSPLATSSQKSQSRTKTRKLYNP